MRITADTFALMVSNLIASGDYQGVDKIANAYYDALEILKLSQVTHIGNLEIGAFK